MTQRKRPPLVFFIIFWIVSIATFMSLSVWIVAKAHGFIFNKRTYQFEPTVLLAFDGYPKEVTFALNGDSRNITMPYRLGQLTPGSYDIEITKEGYQAWTKFYNLTPGQGEDENKILLFYKKPQIGRLPSEKADLDRLEAENKLQNRNLILKENEIWYQEKLVTRFSSPVRSAILGDDRAHIYFQLDSEIRVIEIDGANNTKLITLNSNQKSFLSDKNINLVYNDGAEIYQAQIR